MNMVTPAMTGSPVARASGIEGALSRLPHLGPVRLERLQTRGMRTWDDLLAAGDPLGLRGRWEDVCAAVRERQRAVADDEPRRLAGALHARDHWRVLAHWFDQASFFDIETSGLGAGSEVTLVVCLHRGRLLRYFRGENLDAFLDLLQEVKLMVSYNGTGFDVPRIEDLFHVPSFPCAHVDLRWMCHYRGWHGGLKAIERQLGLRRPADLDGVDGLMAVALWEQWTRLGDAAARRRLERYCAADTVALQRLAAELLAAHGCAVTVPEMDALWQGVTEACPPLDPPPAIVAVPDDPLQSALRAAVDAGSRAARQERLRAHWRAARRLPADPADPACTGPVAWGKRLTAPLPTGRS
jgi:uncharacterized protein YprB with RNaseH-like and TPR domain